MGDAERLEDLDAGGVAVAPEVEEALEHLGGEGGLVLRRNALLRRRLRPVAAHPADLALLVLVVVPADPARVLPLSLLHLDTAPCAAAAATREIGTQGTRGVIIQWDMKLSNKPNRVKIGGF